ncbi:TPA: N-acetyltransferase [Candidatus Poribacteria bacterium]|nr:N-acetyltransferase [Candidatus Poribacteria bacterium]
MILGFIGVVLLIFLSLIGLLGLLNLEVNPAIPLASALVVASSIATWRSLSRRSKRSGKGARPPEIFETSRLRLRPPKMNDAEEIFLSYASDPEVTKYLTWRPHSDINETREFLDRCIREWERGDSFSWVIELRDEGKLIGMIELNISAYRASLGYVLARPYWNRGYATEAAGEVVNWAIEQPHIYRIWAVCDVENVASARVLEKIGMQREGVLRRFILHPNVSDEPRDCYCYSKVKGR